MPSCWPRTARCINWRSSYSLGRRCSTGHVPSAVRISALHSSAVFALDVNTYTNGADRMTLTRDGRIGA
eukprot:36131-Eustigmatos_ZCMA.PRE.1